MTKGELILFGVSEIIYVYCIFSFFGLFLGKNSSKDNILLPLGIVVWFIEMTMIFLETSPSLTLLVNISIFVFLSSKIYGGSKKKIIISNFLILSFLMITDVLSYAVFPRTGIKIVYLFAISVLWDFFWINFIKKYIDIRWKNLPHRYIFAFILIQGVSIFCLLYNYLYNKQAVSYYNFDSFLLALLVINMALLFFYEGIGKYMEETRQKDRIKNQRDGLEKILEEKEHSEMEIRKFRHEYINDLTKLQYLLEEGDCDLAREAIGRHLNNLKRTSKKIWLGDPLLDYLLEEKRQAFLDLGTELIWDIEPIGKRESINFSLYTILENLLKNALEALEGAENKYLSLEISKNQGLEIKIENSFKEKPLTRRGRFYRRDKKVGRGLGLVITQEEVQKLKGKMDISVDDNLFTVFIQIPY